MDAPVRKQQENVPKTEPPSLLRAAKRASEAAKQGRQGRQNKGLTPAEVLQESRRKGAIMRIDSERRSVYDMAVEWGAAARTGQADIVVRAASARHRFARRRQPNYSTTSFPVLCQDYVWTTLCSSP